MEMSAHPPSGSRNRARDRATELIAVYGRQGELQVQIDAVWHRASDVIRDVIGAEARRMAGIFRERGGPGPERVARISASRGQPADYAWLIENAVVGMFERRFDLPGLEDLAEHEAAYLAADAPLAATLSAVARLFSIAMRAVAGHFADDPAFVQTAIETTSQLMAARLNVIAMVYQDSELAREAESRMTEAAAFRELVGGMLGEALAGSKQLRSQSAETSSSARGMLGKASEVAAAAEQSAVAMREAAQTAAGLIRAIEEARSEVEMAAGVALRAGEESDRAVQVSAVLSDHAQAIESILRLIRDIAGQTNLLALNATIEAARAGDAGRGFAVVAQEVKSLASQTARATDDIAAKIGAIQVATRQTVEANGSIRGTIRDVQSSAERIRTAMETQAQTVTMITAAVDETALAADVMSSTIGAIRQGTEQLAGTIDQLDVGFREVDQRLGALGSSAEDFTARLR